MKTKIESFKELYDIAAELGKFRSNYPYRYIPKQKTTYDYIQCRRRENAEN